MRIIKRWLSVLIVFTMLSTFCTAFSFPAAAASSFVPIWPATDPGSRWINVLDRYSRGTLHGGMDINKGNNPKQDIVAVADGTVIIAENGCSHDDNRDSNHNCGSSYGNYVIIEHDVGGTSYYSIYAHLSYNSITVKENDPVRAGKVIGQMGSTGSSDGPHLHFSISEGAYSNNDAQRSRTFDYYKDNYALLSANGGMGFGTNAVTATKIYSSWIAANCKKASVGYVYCGSPGTPEAKPTISISGQQYPTGTLPHNSGYPLRGIVSASTGTLTKVVGTVYNSSGGKELQYTAYPNSPSYNIATSGGINDNLVFNKLPIGKYRYELVATAQSSGGTTTKQLINVWFTVGDISSAPTISASKTSISLGVFNNTSSTLSIYTTGDYDQITYSWDPSCCSVEDLQYSGGAWSCKVTSKAAGKSTLVFSLIDSSENILASLSIPVSVSGSTLSFSSSSVSLNTSNANKACVTVTAGGDLPSQYSLRFSISNGNVSASWAGPWNGNSTDLNITALYAGTDIITVNIINKADDSVLATKSINVSVTTYYTISFDANGGSNAPASQTKEHGKNLTLTTSKPTGKNYAVYYNGNGGDVPKSGETVTQLFKEWNTNASGNGLAYAPGDSFSNDRTMTLYAQYDAAHISDPKPTRTGYSFIGWFDSPEINDYGFPSGKKYTTSTPVEKDITLYAMWHSTEELFMWGDYNFDGEHNLGDVGLLYRLSNKPEDLTPELRFLFDLNADGVITFDDSTGSDLQTLYDLSKGLISLSDTSAYKMFQGIFINTAPKTKYSLGEPFDDAGLTVIARYTNGTSYGLRENITVSGYDPYQLGTQVLTVHYYQFTTTLEVTVEANNPSIHVDIKEILLDLNGQREITVDFSCSGECANGWYLAAYASDFGFQWELGERFTVTAYDVLEDGLLILSAEDCETEEAYCTVEIPVRVINSAPPSEPTIHFAYDAYTMEEGWWFYLPVWAEGLTEGYEIVFESSDESVVMVGEDGGLFAAGIGEADIYAYCKDYPGTYTPGVCHMTVTESSLLIYMNETQVAPGGTVSLPVYLENNPGIWGLALDVEYDPDFLTLTNVENGDIFSDSEWTPGNAENGYYILSYDGAGLEDNLNTGLLATLTFTVSENANVGDYTYIYLSYQYGNIINSVPEIVPAMVYGAYLEISDFRYGDLNGDNAVNKMDILLLRQHLAGHNVTIDLQAADVVYDGAVNKMDSLRLMQYLAGWSVQLGQ